VGWAIIVADVIVMAALAQIAGIYTFLLVGAEGMAEDTFAVTVVGCGFIILVTWICYVGIEVSAGTQYFLLAMEVVALGLFTVVALVRVWFGDVEGSVDPSLSWLNPSGIQGFELSWAELNPFSSQQSALVIGLLLAIFIYWGWDSAVTVNEESSDASRTPGRAAVISTIVLVAIYVVVSIATQAFAGAERLADQDDVLAVVGNEVLGTWLGKLLIVAVLTSAMASCQTTVLPTTRTALSMAAKGAAPSYFARIQPRFLTPSTATVWMGVLSVVWYAGLTLVSEDALSDSLLSLGLMIALYYALTAWACVWYYRKHLFTNARNFLGFGLLPFLGGLSLTWVLIKSSFVLAEPENSNTGNEWFGLGPPLVIGVAFVLLGVVLYTLQRSRRTGFFDRRPEEPTDDIVAGRAIAEGVLTEEEVA